MALLKTYSGKIRIVFLAVQKLCFSEPMAYWNFTQLGQRRLWKLDGNIFYRLTLNSEWHFLQHINERFILFTQNLLTLYNNLKLAPVCSSVLAKIQDLGRFI